MSNLINDFSMDYFRLDNKVAIVTGANTGIGQGFALALAKAGADIFCVARRTSNETKNLIEAEGRRFESIQADLGEKESIQKVIDACMDVYGRIDILVNNAGIIKRNPILEYADADWQSVIKINLDSVYYLSQKAAQIMEKQGGGKIINTASMLSFQGGKFVPSYTAAKHGVAGLTKAFANELADKNIQINAIAPGYVKTDNTSQIRDDESRNNEILSRIPAGRWAEASDLMGAVVFLASKASDYINGHILAVDGGWLVR